MQIVGLYASVDTCCRWSICAYLKAHVSVVVASDLGNCYKFCKCSTRPHVIVLGRTKR